MRSIWTFKGLEMAWCHITGADILPLDYSRVYEQNFYKPVGFWISEGEWLEWMRNECFSSSGVDFKYDMDVDFSGFFVVSTYSDFKDLEREFGVEVDRKIWIDWGKVSKKYSGILFDNYDVVKSELVSEVGFNAYSSWFFGIDIRSACVFDLSCVISITKDLNYEW